MVRSTDAVDSPAPESGPVWVGHDGGLPSYGAEVVVWPQRNLAIAVAIPQKPPAVVDVMLGQLTDRLAGLLAGTP